MDLDLKIHSTKVTPYQFNGSEHWKKMDFTTSVFATPEAFGPRKETPGLLPDVEYSARAHPLSDSSSKKHFDRLKRMTDLIFGAVLLLVSVPVIFLGWLIVRITSTGPGIYTQVRVGLNGRQFRIFKLRTMTHNCEASTGGARWSTKGDSRVTSVGRFLRISHIDELPQLFNVIRGEMSLVGPRPERPEFVKPLSDSLPDYLHRFAVKPGVTGLAQIQLPADSDMDSVRRKIVLDRAYIANRNLWLDLRLIAGTAAYLLGSSYATVRRLFALPSGEIISTYFNVSESDLIVVAKVNLTSSSIINDPRFCPQTAELVGPRV